MNHDSHEKIFPADPRITAYAFGELEGGELKMVEAAIAADPTLQAAVADLRSFGGDLSTALGEEPAIETAPVDATAPKQAAVVAPPKRRLGRLIPFPLHYLATAAAACFAVMVWVRYEQPKASHPDIGTSVATREAPVAIKEASAEVSSARQKLAAHGSASLPGGEAKVGKDAFSNAKLEEHSNLSVTLDVSSKSEYAFRSPDGAIERDQNSTAVGGMLIAPAPEPTVVAMPPPPRPAAAKQSAALTAAGSEIRARREGLVAESPGEVSRSWSHPQRRDLGDVNLSATREARNDSYASLAENAYRPAAEEPLSTFSISVDTASYANVRRFINQGSLPPRDAVRVEELINYFPYRYAPPAPSASRDAPPFAAQLDVASAPWAPAHRLVRVGVKGREISAITRAPANLVFLIDVSGSMSPQNRLPLVKQSLRLLIDRLRPDDRVAIVTYASGSGLALPSTLVLRKNEIFAALDGLRASGSTNGGMGIHLAYDIAKANFSKEGVNRVILCTDGDFNVGVTSRSDLTKLIEEKARSRVFLSVFGFGMGNLKDDTLSTLSSKGNGTYGYIDSAREASKVFVDQLESTLVAIAKDVKIQVEFNPALVQAYRLLGYESRMLKKEDFNDDKVDAGEIGAGHSVTALYEVVPAGVDADDAPRPTVDPLKYQASSGGKRKPRPMVAPAGSASRELLTLKIRHKQPDGDVSAKQEFSLVDSGKRFEQADGEFKFAAAVAAWGMVLRDSPHKGTATFGQVLGWAEDGLGEDSQGYRAEFIQLVRRSSELK